MENSTHTNTFSLENNVSERRQRPLDSDQEPRNKYTKLSVTTQNPIHFENKDIIVKIQGANIPEPVDDFESLQLPRILVENITNADYAIRAPMQRFISPIVFEKRDLVANVNTGSEKTVAYLISIVANLMLEKRRPPSNTISPITIIIAPTRELAIGVHHMASTLAENTDLRCLVIYGGVNIRTQIEQVQRGCDLLVTQPGRLLDMIDRGVITLTGVKTVVLDEIDRLLDMGFEPQLKQFFETSGLPEPGVRNSIFFCAGYSKSVQNFVRNYLYDYISITVSTPSSTPRQQFCSCTVDLKRDLLLKTITKDPTLVFVSTKRRADHIHAFLIENGLRVSVLHGDIAQVDREKVLKNYHRGVTPILVATNLFCKGLTISNVDHVILFEMPGIDDYIYQIGRAATTGVSTTFFTSENNAIAEDLIKYLKETKQEIPEFLYRARTEQHDPRKRHAFGK
jgi:ATP-dependent RNA helicase DDX3X